MRRGIKIEGSSVSDEDLDDEDDQEATPKDEGWLMTNGRGQREERTHSHTHARAGWLLHHCSLMRLWV